MKEFVGVKNMLIESGGCIYWDNRVILPLELREMYLKELHISHQGIVKTKRLAKIHTWCPTSTVTLKP